MYNSFSTVFSIVNLYSEYARALIFFFLQYVPFAQGDAVAGAASTENSGRGGGFEKEG
jgi:hypothetical protein